MTFTLADPAFLAAAQADPGTYAQAVLADAPLGYWPLDGDGTNVAGEGRTLSATGTLTWHETGGPDGGGYVACGGGRLTLAYEAALNSAGSPFAVEVWFRTAGPGAGSPPLHIAGRDDNTAAQVWALNTRSTLRLGAYTRSGSTYYSEMGADNDYTAAVWHQAVFEFTGTHHNIYLNGALLHGPTSAGVASQTTLPLTFGAKSNGSNPFAGDLAHVSYYTAALTAARVAAHHAAMGS